MDKLIDQVKDQIDDILSQLDCPKKALITSGMPYSNGFLHLGHLAGTFIPADVYARWMRMVIGQDNVLLICGSDDHGVASKLTAIKQNIDHHKFIKNMHRAHHQTLANYNISLDIYSSTSNSENLYSHSKTCNHFIEALVENGYFSIKQTAQWYDPILKEFLVDRYVTGSCPYCGYDKAYSMECENCLSSYLPSQLINPKSSITHTTPILKQTKHLWFDFYSLASLLLDYLNSNKKNLHKSVYQELYKELAPGLIIAKKLIDCYNPIKELLPKHKKKFTRNGDLILLFADYDELSKALDIFTDNNLSYQLKKQWAQRCFSRDTDWGIKLDNYIENLGTTQKSFKDKSLYVWPESLIAPISFTKQILAQRNYDDNHYKQYWYQKQASCHQFIGIDNIYFYGVMQNAMWLGASIKKPTTPTSKPSPKKNLLNSPIPNTIHSRFHLLVEGKKMSKSYNNFILGDELIEKYSADQIRYFVSLMSLTDKPASFDFETFNRKNAFLSTTLNAVFEKPISAAHSKFAGVVPDGKLLEKVGNQTIKIVKSYVQFMPDGKYSQFIVALEKYARLVNSLFSIYKPHDDRYPLQERKDCLFSCFYILNNLVIFLFPFVPDTIERLMDTLRLDKKMISSINNIGCAFSPNHQLGKPQEFFPSAI